MNYNKRLVSISKNTRRKKKRRRVLDLFRESQVILEAKVEEKPIETGIVYKLPTSDPEEKDYNIYERLTYEQFVIDWESLNSFQKN